MEYLTRLLPVLPAFDLFRLNTGASRRRISRIRNGYATTACKNAFIFFRLVTSDAGAAVSRAMEPRSIGGHGRGLVVTRGGRR